ncbi:hypothetical protein SE17_37790 [Kouleothrix aurantiaca]|uniref:Uncharacterized protein n=1 Tax=Kouleothrix aurantiaca TaxID=186479 RepID=A0A0P9EVU8_9CHLR|nr:hypothetical protein SE17_37790 [Kouleothrix aurantiaca]
MEQADALQAETGSLKQALTVEAVMLVATEARGHCLSVTAGAARDGQALSDAQTAQSRKAAPVLDAMFSEASLCPKNPAKYKEPG